uniref:Uncharacterized protein n=1 Tax=Sphaerodactylus townsendi TaxID=933632 RepID=A0ACB8G183_9SAUR
MISFEERVVWPLLHSLHIENQCSIFGMERPEFRALLDHKVITMESINANPVFNQEISGGALSWVREFLNEENKGLDVLVEYLSFAQYAVTFDFESLENNMENSVDKSKPWSRSIEDLHRGSNLPSPVGNSISRSGRHSTLR